MCLVGQGCKEGAQFSILKLFEVPLRTCGGISLLLTLSSVKDFEWPETRDPLFVGPDVLAMLLQQTVHLPVQCLLLAFIRDLRVHNDPGLKYTREQISQLGFH